MSKIAYILLGCAVFIAAILVMAPAGILTTAFGKDLEQRVPGLKLGAANGRVWRGSLPLQYGRFPAINMTWNLSALALATGELSADIVLSGEGLYASGHTTVSRGGGSVQSLNAKVSSRFINTVSVGYGLDLTGSLQIEQVAATFDREWLTALSGDINWPGGIIHIETPEKFHTVKLPPINGMLSLHERIANLTLRQQDTQLLDIDLKEDGWSKVSITYALMDMAGIPTTGGINASGPAFQLEEKVF